MARLLPAIGSRPEPRYPGLPDERGRDVPRFDLGRQQPDDQMNEEGDENEIVHHSRQWDGEIDRIERIEPEDYRDRPQPDRPPPVPQREPEQTQIARDQPPEAK